MDNSTEGSETALNNWCISWEVKKSNVVPVHKKESKNLIAQAALTCSKLAIEMQEQGVKYVQS